MFNNSVENCPFCNKDITQDAFMQTGNFFALYNISPILPGHSLVIPKFHYQSFMELEKEKVGELFIFAQKVIRVLLMAFQSNGFNLTIQDGKNAGQTINHLHLHLIPRKEKDLPNPGDWYPLLNSNENQITIESSTRIRIDKKEFDDISNELKKISLSID
jgi:bis(5'-adenosyl)-triphosphatase